MIDVAYENVIQFDMVDDTLEGRDLLESKVYEVDKEYENTIKMYFDLDNEKEKNIYFETEKYVSEDYKSNKTYLLLKQPSANSAYKYLSFHNILYLFGIDFKLIKKNNMKRLKVIQRKKNPLYAIDEDLLEQSKLKNILFQILMKFYRYRLLNKQVYMTLCSKFYNINTNKIFDMKTFLQIYQKDNLFTLGYVLNGKKYLFCENEDYIKYLISEQKKSSDDSKLEVIGVCDFCKQTKKLIDVLGKGQFFLKHLKNFTSTMESVLYGNNSKTLEKNIRCCVDCFENIERADDTLQHFQIGKLKEIKIKNKKSKKKSKEKSFNVYGFIDIPFSQDIEYDDIKSAMQYLFGDKNALTTIQKVIKNEEIFDEDWKVILNIFITEKEKLMHQSILNLRNINPHLFKKYNQIFNFINELNDELTYRTWKGNFSDIFSTISKADKRVSFEIFEAFLNEKELEIEKLIKKFLPLVKRKFIASIDEKVYQAHYKYLLLDIANILIIDNLRKKEKNLTFDIDNIIESYENDNKKKLYRKKETKEIAETLGFEWSNLEIGLFDLGMILQETVSDVKSNKSTDIEKVFMRKMNFTGMRIDEVMGYIGYIEDKFKDYGKFIYRLDNKRERLSDLGIALNQKEIDISPEKSAYLIAFGYELSTTISNKIGAKINKEKEENK